LTPTELKEGLTKAGLKEIPKDLEEIMKDVDADGSGVIDYTEFLAATLDKRVMIQEDVVWAAFRQFDKNGDGVIDKDELRAFLGSNEDQDKANLAELTEKSLQQIMEEVDDNGDGQISFEEFMKMMRPKKDDEADNNEPAAK